MLPLDITNSLLARFPFFHVPDTNLPSPQPLQSSKFKGHRLPQQSDNNSVSSSLNSQDNTRSNCHDSLFHKVGGDNSPLGSSSSHVSECKSKNNCLLNNQASLDNLSSPSSSTDVNDTKKGSTKRDTEHHHHRVTFDLKEQVFYESDDDDDDDDRGTVYEPKTRSVDDSLNNPISIRQDIVSLTSNTTDDNNYSSPDSKQKQLTYVHTSNEQVEYNSQNQVTYES